MQLVAVVSTLVPLAVMAVVSVVLISLTKGDGEEISAELERAGRVVVEPETELVHVVADGQVVVRVRAGESRDEDGGLVAVSGGVFVFAG